jgi:hypothetical protein
VTPNTERALVRRRLLVLGAGLILVVVAAIASCPAPQPPEFVSTKHKFRAQFGGEPEVTTNEAAGIRTTLYALVGTDGERTVVVTEVPVPEDIPPERAALILRSARDELVGAAGGELVSDTSTTLSGKYHGRKFTATNQRPHPGVMRAHIYLINKRLYQVVVKGTQEYANAPASTAFLDSFTLVE